MRAGHQDLVQAILYAIPVVQAFQSDVSESRDGIHGRTEIVGDVRQEGRFRLAALLGQVKSRLQRPFLTAQEPRAVRALLLGLMQARDVLDEPEGEVIGVAHVPQADTQPTAIGQLPCGQEAVRAPHPERIHLMAHPGIILFAEQATGELYEADVFRFEARDIASRWREHDEPAAQVVEEDACLDLLEGGVGLADPLGDPLDEEPAIALFYGEDRDMQEFGERKGGSIEFAGCPVIGGLGEIIQPGGVIMGPEFIDVLAQQVVHRHVRELCHGGVQILVRESSRSAVVISLDVCNAEWLGTLVEYPMAGC